MESFLEPKSERFLKRNEILVMGGMINTNIYVVEEGFYVIPIWMERERLPLDLPCRVL